MTGCSSGGCPRPGRPGPRAAGRGTSGTALADVLIARGFADRADVYRAVAEAAGLEYTDLSESEVDDTYQSGTDVHHMVENCWVPVRSRPGTPTSASCSPG